MVLAFKLSFHKRVMVPMFDVAEEKVKNMSKRSDFNKVQGTQPQGRSVSVQSCRVTYGGIDGAYYTSTRNRRAGNDGVSNTIWNWMCYF